MTEPTPPSSQASEDLTLGWSVPDGAPSPSPRSTPTPAPSSPSDGRESRTSGRSPLSLTGGGSDSSASQRVISDRAEHPTLSSTWGGTRPAVLRSGPAGSPARISASQGSDTASPASDLASPSPSSGLWNDIDLRGSSWRTFPASSAPTAAEISPAFSGGYPNSGMAWRGESSTLAITAWRSDEGEYSSWPRVTLADVLEPTAPQRFFLSPRAAAGILRRAAKRGRELPASLSLALTSLAASHGDMAKASPPLTTEPSSSPVLLTMREGKDGGGKGPLISENASLTLGTSPTQTLFDGPQVRRLTPRETEALMGWPAGHTIVHDWKKGR